MPAVFGSPEHWHNRAEEMRTMAEQMTEAAVRQSLLSIAAGYDRIAKQAEAAVARNAQNPSSRKPPDVSGA